MCRMSVSEAVIEPPVRSLWPPKYFVSEWITMSAPNSSGRITQGVVNVLSTTVSAPCSFASFATFSMSTTAVNGLAMISV